MSDIALLLPTLRLRAYPKVDNGTLQSYNKSVISSISSDYDIAYNKIQ